MANDRRHLFGISKLINWSLFVIWCLSEGVYLARRFLNSCVSKGTAVKRSATIP
jgi:hypothetical protein